MATRIQTGFVSGFFPDSILTPAGWARSSGWTSILEGKTTSTLAAANNAVFTFSALGALYGCFDVYTASVTNADILTFDNVVLRIVSSTQIAVRIGATNYTATITTPATINTWYGVRFKIVLGTTNTDCSFEWNGINTATATAASANNTAATVNIGPSSGRVGSIVVNDNSGTVNNTIPVAIPTFEMLKAASVGATSNWTAGGLATIPAWYSGSAASWVAMPSTSQWAYLDQVRNRVFKLSSTGALVTSFGMLGAATDFATLSTFIGNDHLVYFSGSSKAIVELTSGTAYTGNTLTGITNANWVTAGAFYYRTAGNTTLQKFSSSLVFSANITISTVNTGGVNNYYSSAKGYLFCSPAATTLSCVLVSTAAVTNLTIAGGGVASGFLERAADNKVYAFSGTNTYVINTTGTPTLSATVANGFTPAQGQGQTGRYGQNQGDTFAWDSVNDAIYGLAADGSIYKFTVATNTWAYFGVSPSGANSELSLYCDGGKIYCNSKSGVRIYDGSTGSLLASLVFPVATATYSRMWDDGTYICVAIGNEIGFVNKTTNVMVVATDKAVCSRGVTNGASTVISYLIGDAASSARQDLTLASLVGSPSNIAGINIYIGRAYKNAIGTGTLLVGIKCADGTDVDAGTSASLSTTPTDFQRQLIFKTGTTLFTPSDLAGGSVYIVAQPF